MEWNCLGRKYNLYIRFNRSYIYWNIGWSLDSKSIAFKARSADGPGTFLAVADSDSPDGFRIVFPGPGYINEDFAWHPDGRRVVFSVVDQPSNISRLVFVNRDAPGIPERIPGQPDDWNLLGSDWSPDGKQIAFSAHALPKPVEWLGRSQ